MSVAVCATSLTYCFLPLALNLSGTLSQQVSAAKASASCFAKACLAAATNLASSSDDAARLDCNCNTKTEVRTNINIFISVIRVGALWSKPFMVLKHAERKADRLRAR